MIQTKEISKMIERLDKRPLNPKRKFFMDYLMELSAPKVAVE